MSATNRSGQKGLAAAHDLVAFPVVFATALARGESGAQETGRPTRESRETAVRRRIAGRRIRPRRAQLKGGNAGDSPRARQAARARRGSGSQDAAAFRPPGCGTTRRRLAVYGETWRDEKSNGSNLLDVEREEGGHNTASEAVQSGMGWRQRQTESVDAKSTDVDGWSTQVDPDLPTRRRQTLPRPIGRGKQALPTGARNAVTASGTEHLRAFVSIDAKWKGTFREEFARKDGEKVTPKSQSASKAAKSELRNGAGPGGHGRVGQSRELNRYRWECVTVGRSAPWTLASRIQFEFATERGAKNMYIPPEKDRSI
ncbi:hypothetical protein DFH06DRAFT_1131685 [Mycena polygramma]|nr:hypothetical protein DFH06DRAFT_1131685 [Mycena polygramma]